VSAHARDLTSSSSRPLRLNPLRLDQLWQGIAASPGEDEVRARDLRASDLRSLRQFDSPALRQHITETAMTPGQPPLDSFENTDGVPPAATGIESAEATCRMEVSPDDVLNSADLEDLVRSAPLRGFSKQEVDFAFAAELIRSKHISE
jgi:hypothetical protein